jgi:hypothetical protein
MSKYHEDPVFRQEVFDIARAISSRTTSDETIWVRILAALGEFSQDTPPKSAICVECLHYHNWTDGHVCWIEGDRGWRYCKDRNPGGKCKSYKAKEAEQAAEAKSPWISVKDRLPDKKMEVLCYTAGAEGEDVQRGTWIPLPGYWQGLDVASNGRDNKTIHCVYYWMPFPVPPEE